jgi:broad specificity phosphatase PhoE
MAMRVIYIVRHGARIDSKNPAWRKQAAYPHDPGLSPLGRDQADQLATHLLDKGIQHVFSSPYLRARQTAEPVSKALGLSLQIEDGLGEWLNAEWFNERPEFCEPVSLEHSLVRAEFPETDEQAWARSGKAARMIAGQFSGNILLVAHGHTMCGAIFGLLDRRDVDIKCNYCSLAEVRMENHYAVLANNGDTSFLNAPEKV